jgi:hypothetical protein
MDWAEQTNRRSHPMQATLGFHLALFYQVSRYILECNGQVTESQLFWNNPKMTEEEYGFFLDFNYLQCDIVNNVMAVRLSPLWESKMKAHHNIKEPPDLYWSQAAEAEFARHAQQMRWDERKVKEARRTIENLAYDAEYIGLVAVLKYLTPQ